MWRLAPMLLTFGCAVTVPVEAADLISYPTTAAAQVPVVGDSADWNGFYAGVFGTVRQGASGDQFGLGVDFGVSTTVNFVLAGAEVAVEGLGSAENGATYVQGVGRAGVLLTDTALVYGAAGYGDALGASGAGEALLGGGVELGLTRQVSVRAQYLRGVPINGSAGSNQITLGAQFHF
jgi:outer membrane immunogenic protein